MIRGTLWLALVVAACGEAPSEADAPSLPPQLAGLPVGDPLEDAAFAFCHEEGADADQLARWCDLLDRAPPEVCPGMRATCASGDFTAQATGCEGAFGQGGRGYAGEAGAESPWRRQDGCEGLDCASEGTGGLQAALRWVAAAAVAALLLVLARLLLARLGWLDAVPSREPSGARVASPVEPALEGDDDLGAVPEEELMARARAALAAGRLADAVVFARGATLRRLARRGLLRLHRARTDREYLRGVQGEPATRDALALVLDAVEDVRWAGRSLTEPRASQAVEAAARIVGMLLLTCGLVVPEASAARRFGPNGDVALARILDEAGFERQTEAGTFADLDDTADVVVLDLYGVEVDDASWAHVMDWVAEGGLLIVAGDPGDHVPGLGTHGLFTGNQPLLATRGFLRQADVDVPRWPLGPTYQWCDGDGVPLVVLPQRAGRVRAGSSDEGDCAVPRVVQALGWGAGHVVALSDASVLANGAMVLAENRAFLPALLLAGRDAGQWDLPQRPKVLLATVSSGEGASNPFSMVANARLLPFLLQLFVFWCLLALWRGWPLTEPRDAEEDGRIDFLEHARALGRHWEQLGASRHAAAAHAKLALVRLGREGVAAAALRDGLAPDRAHAFVERIEALAADPDAPDDPDDFELVEALWRMMSRRSARRG